MTDLVLSTKRYLGSDDSDFSDGDHAAAKLSEVIEQAKKRKREAEKLNFSDLSLANADVSSSVVDEERLVVHKAKKRKKKHSVENCSAPLKCTISSENITTDVSAHSVESHDLSPHKVMSAKNRGLSIVELSDDCLEVNMSDNIINSDHALHTSLHVPNNTSTKKCKNQKSIENTTHQNILDVDLVADAKDLNLSKNSEDDSDLNSQTRKNEAFHCNEMFTVIGEVKTGRSNHSVKRILPDWLANPTVISVDLEGKKSLTSELDYLDKNARNNLERLKITHLFPVQVEVVPWLLHSNLKRLCVHPSDICVSAPTGSGKTLAFVIPIVQSLKERVVCQVRALVVLPVGDLAVQVFKVFEQFCRGTDLHVALVVGQRSFLQEQNSLVNKGVRGFHSVVDIIVATPGRLIDHISHTEGFTLEYLKYLVVDEADRMMEEIQQGFMNKVEKAIFKGAASSSSCSCFSVERVHKKTALPPSTPCSYGHISEPVQKLLYSATLSQDPERLHELSLFQPKLFTSVSKHKYGSNCLETVSESNIIGKYTTPTGLVEEYVVCVPSVKPLIVSHLIQLRNFKRVLCFTKSLDSVHRLRLVLDNMDNLKVREMSSSLQPVQRKIILEQFASGKIHILVCTDMMARGIDIENVDCVISYDMPEFIKTYIHRVGRTARAGRTGCAITLLESREIQRFLNMLKRAGKLSAKPLEIDFEDLKPMEEQYRTALDSVSKIIGDEKRNKFLLRESVKSVKTMKNGKFRNSVKPAKNYSTNKS